MSPETPNILGSNDSAQLLLRTNTQEQTNWLTSTSELLNYLERDKSIHDNSNSDSALKTSRSATESCKAYWEQTIHEKLTLLTSIVKLTLPHFLDLHKKYSSEIHDLQAQANNTSQWVNDLADYVENALAIDLKTQLSDQIRHTISAKIVEMSLLSGE